MVQRTQLPDSDSDHHRREGLREEILGLLEDAGVANDPDPDDNPVIEWLPPPPSFTPATPVPDAPPPYHRNAIECPQCDRWTWRATEKCLWCRYNLFAHYEREEEEKLARHRERAREYRARLRGRMALWVVGLLILGMGLIGKSASAPDGLRLWMVNAGVVAMLMALIIGKLMPRE